MNEKQVLEIINKVTVKIKPSVTKNGERFKLTINYNEELQKVFKKCVINDFTSFLFSQGYGSNKIESSYERYKVKSVIFNSITNSYRDCIFIKNLIDGDKTIFEFKDRENLESFKRAFSKNLFELLNTYFSSELEQTISFNLKLENKQEEG